ncbi:hypothetical protein ACFSQU_17290 [Massilia sp. GCM10020059]|uniref:Uncharacterized protein n=1 Tax=Massilia agrisoli TaxID=2892444 RepID=A0ABS8IU81_9BURK|nr:hypothetical protein [Massilia agrisoli]MCC6071293.1 hypothetical protein [Massilia agrisoli]
MTNRNRSPLACAAFVALACSCNAMAQTRSEVEAAKNALDLKLYQATTDALVAQREAEIRKATAEAERAELLARLPPAESKALAGTVNSEAFGAAGLVRAFDLAQALSSDVCTALPAERKATIYEPAATQGVVSARLVSDGIKHISDDLSRQNDALQKFIDQHTPPVARTLSLVGLAAVPATIKAVADISALFRSNAAVASTSYGDDARAMFITSLAQACPDKIVGLGSGYMGEFDPSQYDKLMAKVRALVGLRSAYGARVAIVQKMADSAKGEAKKDYSAVASAAVAVLKTVDAFIDSLKVGEASDKSPLFNAGRYLAYGERTRGALVLDFNLRLEGMTVMKHNLFTGQHLRLSGVALLWYRIYEANGMLRLANSVRKISAPVDVDLRGKDVGGQFWDTPSR